MAKGDWANVSRAFPTEEGIREEPIFMVQEDDSVALLYADQFIGWAEHFLAHRWGDAAVEALQVLLPGDKQWRDVCFVDTGSVYTDSDAGVEFSTVEQVQAFVCVFQAGRGRPIVHWTKPGSRRRPERAIMEISYTRPPTRSVDRGDK